MKTTKTLIVLLAVLLTILACHKGKPSAGGPGGGPGQLLAGTLSGTVTDETGAPIPGASVQATGPNLHGVQGAATDIDGRFTLHGLPAGKGYRVTVEAMGFNKVAQSNISVAAGGATQVPVVLGQGMSEIVVMAAAPIIDTKKTEVGANISDEMIRSIPLPRSAGGVAYLAPGAVTSGLDANEPSIAGVGGPENLYTVNGVEVIERPEVEAQSADQLIVIQSAKEKDGTGEEGGEVEGEAPPATQGTLRAQNAEGEVVGEFPLKHTEVEAFVGGYLARTVVRQEYTNPFTEPIEAVYVFPLGAMAAVNDFVMQVGERKIVGIVRPREEAERIYQEARARGQTASLLTQERPNCFTQNVANIEPGGAVTITITTFERLSYEKGTYEYVFPMVVGPRYIPGGAQAGTVLPEAPGGSGWSAPTDVVPDAHRVTPPVLKPGERSGHDIGLTVHLEAGIPLTEVKSLAHKVAVTELGATKRLVKLSQLDAIPNRDFVLRWKVEASKMRFGVLPYRDKNDGYFTLMVQPPLDPRDADVSPREITFILDVSGSMDGIPVETSKALVRGVLDKLRPEDVFNVFIFAGEEGQLWESPRPSTPENVAAAKAYLTSLEGAGGTEMLAGVSNAVKANHDPKFLQMYVFATDGNVGDEERILAFIERERGEARFFAFGIGDGVNRYLIDGIGAVGGGKSMVVMPSDGGSAARAADLFFQNIDSPVLVDAAVDWNGLPVEDAYPSRLGDLFAGGTIDVVARYTKPATGTVYVTGRVGARHVRFPVQVVLPAGAAEHSELAPVWARFKIADLSREMLGAPEEKKLQLVKSITDLAVEYRLVSQYTAFVAVDESRVVGDGKPLKIVQPVELTSGTSYEGVFGEPGTGGVSSLPAWGVRLQETQSGRLRVGEADPAGAASKAGVPAGAELKAVNGTAVHDLVHLEGLLLQAPGGAVRVTFEPGGEVSLPL